MSYSHPWSRTTARPSGGPDVAQAAYELKPSPHSSHGRLLAWLSGYPPSRILDVGCSDGRFGELVSAFFFESGQPRGAQFQHLTGEEAFWQLFLAADLHGTFSFTSGPPSISQSIRGGEIARSANDMLINALQARDEFHSLRAALPGTTIIERHTRKLDVGASAPADVRQVMEQIWALPFEDSTPVRTLYPQLAVSELKIYQAVTELLKAKQMTLLPAPLPAKVA